MHVWKTSQSKPVQIYEQRKTLGLSTSGTKSYNVVAKNNLQWRHFKNRTGQVKAPGHYTLWHQVVNGEVF